MPTTPSNSVSPLDIWRLSLTHEEQAQWVRFQVHDPETGFLVGFRDQNKVEFARMRAKIDEAARALLAQ